jgi:hypothetical protein
MIEKVTQVVDTKGKLKTKKCPKCKMDAMYFNFHEILICRNCGYMPSCPTCKRHYQMDNYFKGEKGNIEHMQKPPEYENTKHALSYLVGQLAGLLQWNGHYTHPTSKEELVYDIDHFLKSYNDSHNLGIDRYTEKKVETKEDLDLAIERKKQKIAELKRNEEYHHNWAKDRIKGIEEEIKILYTKKVK